MNYLFKSNFYWRKIWVKLKIDSFIGRFAIILVCFTK